MIQTDEQLQQTQAALCRLESSLAALNRQRAGIHPDRFQLMSEPILEQIRRLRSEIDAYLRIPVVAE